jgi:hypothetical protein
MAYHEELIQLAFQLVDHVVGPPNQARLRRAVSTAYYALFHCLIHDATLNWSQAEFRPDLARAFDHTRMKEASNSVQQQRSSADDLVTVALREVARTFVELQARREAADYDHAKTWTQTEALADVQLADQALTLWYGIRNEPVAQRYLMSLLVRKRR